MKKSKLIELLNKLEGDPDLLYWNGIVGDFQDFKVSGQDTLVKHTMQHLYHYIDLETKSDNGNFKPLSLEVKKYNYLLAKEQFHEQQWELPNEFLEEGRYKAWYGGNEKSVVYLDSTERGKTSWDRSGDISY